eukprot:COSAG02_NODE_58469_length_277_cov_0.674157_1_plen_38_part_10
MAPEGVEQAGGGRSRSPKHGEDRGLSPAGSPKKNARLN